MNWVISGTWGPTDPTRAMLPFLFAASAVQAGEDGTIPDQRCTAIARRRRA
jgi:hypothetical protein